MVKKAASEGSGMISFKNLMEAFYEEIVRSALASFLCCAVYTLSDSLKVSAFAVESRHESWRASANS